MIWADVAKVLAKLAAFDQRTVGEADMAAWHEVIGPLELEDCLVAVTVHYKESTARAMPADIRRLARGVRDQREARERQIEGRRAIEAGPPTRSPEVTKLIRELAEKFTPPEPDDPSERIQHRAIKRARKVRGRPEPPKQQPKKRRKNKDWPAPATDEVARFAMRYLIDGHSPADVSERLAVSKKWCERMVRKFKNSTEGEAS